MKKLLPEIDIFILREIIRLQLDIQIKVKYSMTMKPRADRVAEKKAAQKEALQEKKIARNYSMWRDGALRMCKDVSSGLTFNADEKALLDNLNLVRVCYVEAGIPAEFVDAANLVGVGVQAGKGDEFADTILFGERE